MINSAASGRAKPPEIPRSNGSPSKSPFATADVASSAPQRRARSRSALRYAIAPRPARNTGRSAAFSRFANCFVAYFPDRIGTGRDSGSTARGSADCACTSRGTLSTTVRRPFRAVRHARSTSSTADSAESTRSGIAPVARTSPSESIRKFDRTAAEATSAASTSSGVRLFAASVIPVTALVSPGPWCTDKTVTNPLVRAKASAMLAAPPSCRAATNGTPAARRALVMAKLPLPTTPNACPTPSCASVRPTSSETRISASGCSTNATTRAGLPVPPTIGSGVTTSTAPVIGQPVQVLQLGQSVGVGAQQEIVRRETAEPSRRRCRRRCPRSRRQSR